jgi:hypothetical protein
MPLTKEFVLKFRCVIDKSRKFLVLTFYIKAATKKELFN